MAGRLQSAMSSGPAVAFTKTVLTVFNFIFWITGIAILALGIWTKVELYIYMELSTIYYEQAPYVMIGVGAFIVIVGSFGCCCTVKGQSVLLYMYAVFLIVVFIAELSCGAAGFVYRNKINQGFSDGLKKALPKYGVDKEKTKAFDGLQHELKCCGNNNYTDWFSTPWEKTETKGNKTLVVPKSCCRGDQGKCVNYNLVNKNATADIYTDGCYNVVTGFMKKNMALIGGVALGVSFLQLFGAALACCLAKNINKAKYEQVQ